MACVRVVVDNDEQEKDSVWGSGLWGVAFESHYSVQARGNVVNRRACVRTFRIRFESTKYGALSPNIYLGAA
jgi:hypothetical protein